MGKGKSLLLTLEEETGIISANPHLNQRFVKEEIFKEEILKAMGFHFEDGKLHSVHNDNEAQAILSDISKKVEQKVITTRKNRGKVVEVLEPNSQELIDRNKPKKPHPTRISFAANYVENKKRRSRRTPKKISELFGGRLYLRIGEVSNLYRDISDIFEYYTTHKSRLSQTFPSIIRMSLRLLCETAANDKNTNIHNYIRNNFNKAKPELDKDTKTTLANQNVNRDSLIQLLHTGAHNYESSSNVEQTIAMSIIIGAIITVTHGKD